MPLDADALAAHVDRLERDPDALETLLDAMRSELDGQGLRATYASPLREMMASHGAEAADSYSELVDPLPSYPPFAFMPIPELVLRLAAAATILAPETELRAGTNDIMAEHVASMRRHGTLKAMLEAGGDRLFDYLDLVTESAEHFYNFGQRTSHRITPRHMVLRFEGYSPSLSRYWIPGLNRGLMNIFEREGELEWVDIDDERFEIHVRLESIDESSED